MYVNPYIRGSFFFFSGSFFRLRREFFFSPLVGTLKMNTNSSYKSWDDFLEDHRSNPHKLIDWIKQNHPELVEKAKNGNLSPGTICFWQKVLNSELVRVNPRYLHGDVMVTDAIEKESKLTAVMQTISNWWNTVGVAPIAYAGVGGGVSGVISAVIVIVLCQLAGNSTSTAASNANPASRKWANRSLWANISLQVVLTLISGVGSEILTNSTADLPYCRKPKRLEADGKKLRGQGQKQLDTLQSTVEQSGGSLEYLKKEKRGLYSQHFTENGRIAAGQEAVSTSMRNFSSKLITGEWDKLGFPLTFASLSVIFSSASILMTLWHRNKASIALTFDPTAKQAFDELIHAVAEGLNNQEPPAIDDDNP